MSNTPAVALPYSAGKAPVRKSELAIKFGLSAETGPPVVPSVEKWLGFGIGIPSRRQSTPVGELPRIMMSLRASLLAATPAKLATILATSLRPPE